MALVTNPYHQIPTSKHLRALDIAFNRGSIEMFHLSWPIGVGLLQPLLLELLWGLNPTSDKEIPWYQLPIHRWGDEVPAGGARPTAGHPAENFLKGFVEEQVFFSS
jgi:hypothetical protein